MTEIQQESPDKIPENVNVWEAYGIGRSIRRVTEVRALNKRFPYPVISTINRWQNIEQAKGMRIRFSMLDNYADVVLMLCQLKTTI